MRLWLTLDVNSRILLVRFKFSKAEVCVAVVYDYTEEDLEEKERFWNYLHRLYKFCIIGDVNGWIGDWVRVSTTLGFGVPEENENRGRMGFAGVIHISRISVYITTVWWLEATMEWR